AERRAVEVRGRRDKVLDALLRGEPTRVQQPQHAVGRPAPDDRRREQAVGYPPRYLDDAPWSHLGYGQQQVDHRGGRYHHGAAGGRGAAQYVTLGRVVRGEQQVGTVHEGEARMVREGAEERWGGAEREVLQVEESVVPRREPLLDRRGEVCDVRPEARSVELLAVDGEQHRPVAVRLGGPVVRREHEHVRPDRRFGREVEV